MSVDKMGKCPKCKARVGEEWYHGEILNLYDSFMGMAVSHSIKCDWRSAIPENSRYSRQIPA